MIIELKAHKILCFSLYCRFSSVVESRFEETSKGLYFKLQLKAGSTVHLDHTAQGFFRWGLESLQGWRFHSLPGQLDLVHNYVPGEKCFPITSWKLQRTRITSLSPLVTLCLMQHRMPLAFLTVYCGQESVSRSFGHRGERN